MEYIHLKIKLVNRFLPGLVKISVSRGVCGSGSHDKVHQSVQQQEEKWLSRGYSGNNFILVVNKYLWESLGLCSRPRTNSVGGNFLWPKLAFRDHSQFPTAHEGPFPFLLHFSAQRRRGTGAGSLTETLQPHNGTLSGTIKDPQMLHWMFIFFSYFCFCFLFFV